MKQPLWAAMRSNSSQRVVFPEPASPAIKTSEPEMALDMASIKNSRSFSRPTMGPESHEALPSLIDRQESNGSHR
jgi:hypothetical protein